MRIVNSNICLKAFALVLFLGCVTMLFSAEATFDDKIIIDVSGKAKSTGAVVFSFTPENGEAKEIKVTIAEKMGEKPIAEAIVKEFKVVLGEAYKVHDEDGHKVKIKALGESPKFKVAMKENSVQGVSLIIKKD